ncbi:putative kow domain-containing protein domain-containing protein [Rosellinia necatrix]|uniref:Putative kow domain-containing protein domain-containing protein n=1 Tax=Rosellinia necatrix TaxID=77044 RepID=A0A1S7UKL2_ROSNE|nr:putative kow domain-containing protein domain-containing protein [Rosellinia necatrix]
MQKIARRVATAERVAAKRRKAKDVRFYKKQKKDHGNDITAQVEWARKELDDAKKAIRNDWAMGPIAPRRDAGEWHGAHGAIGESRFASSGSLSLALRNARCQWAGGAYYLCLAKGDRVVLLDGPDKGRIGRISTVNHATGELTIHELNKSNVRLNEYMRITSKDPPAVNIEIPVLVSSVRLVHPITDPSTGITRDVIINRLVHSNLVTDRQTGMRRWDRVVPGLNVSIPWPVKEEREIPEYKADTMRIDVEEKTFVPTLLRPPMPEAVIDELRGKYSRFRTRHEPDYIARLEAEEQAKKDRAKLMDSMRTPLQEFHRAERANKKKKGKPRLTVEMLEKIGEVIAKNRERMLNAGGVSDALPPRTSADVPPPIRPAAEPSAPPPSS